MSKMKYGDIISGICMALRLSDKIIDSAEKALIDAKVQKKDAEKAQSHLDAVYRHAKSQSEYLSKKGIEYAGHVAKGASGSKAKSITTFIAAVSEELNKDKDSADLLDKYWASDLER